MNNLSFVQETEDTITIKGECTDGFLIACLHAIAKQIATLSPSHYQCKTPEAIRTLAEKKPFTKESKMPTHSEMVKALVKPGEAILLTLTPAKADLWHGATGVVGEAGELIDAVKKHVIYNKPLDLINVIEELGDLEFYMEQIRQNLGITREETLGGNIAKLSKRYEGLKYSDAGAQARADKEAGK